MGVVSVGPDADEFEAFVQRVERALREALVASYGPTDGREATVDALSWAWENWSKLDGVDNPVGYLYRVGQSATRRFAARHLPMAGDRAGTDGLPDVDPGLVPALGRLTVQQRTVVVLVHAFGWRHTEVAAVLDISPPTVRTHLSRALARLRNDLEVEDAS